MSMTIACCVAEAALSTCTVGSKTVMKSQIEKGIVGNMQPRVKSCRLAR